MEFDLIHQFTQVCNNFPHLTNRTTLGHCCLIWIFPYSLCCFTCNHRMLSHRIIHLSSSMDDFDHKDQKSVHSFHQQKNASMCVTSKFVFPMPGACSMLKRMGSSFSAFSHFPFTATDFFFVWQPLFIVQQLLSVFDNLGPYQDIHTFPRVPEISSWNKH